jgi:hypothetical protein
VRRLLDLHPMQQWLPDLHRKQSVPVRGGLRRRFVRHLYLGQSMRSERCLHGVAHGILLHVLDGWRLRLRRNMCLGILLGGPVRLRRPPTNLLPTRTGMHQRHMRSVLDVR